MKTTLTALLSVIFLKKRKKSTRLLYLPIVFIPSLLLLSTGAAARPLNIKISPNGKHIAVRMYTGIYIYDTQTGEAVSQFIKTRTREKSEGLPIIPQSALTFSMDSRLIASAHGNSVYIWETATGTSIGTPTKHSHTIKAIAFSPHNTKLAITGKGWSVHLWELSSGSYIRSFKHSSAVNAVAFSPDGSILASAGGNLRLWDTNTGEELHADSRDLGSVNHLIFSPDGNTLASGGEWEHTVRLWDVKTGMLKQSLEGHIGEIRDIAFSSEGHTLITASQDKTILLWDVETGEKLKHFYTPVDEREKYTTGKKTDDVAAAQFSQDEKHLLVASRFATLHLCDADTGRYQKGHFEFNISMDE